MYRENVSSQHEIKRPKRSKAKTIGTIFFLTAVVLTCLALGYWQFSRWDSSRGTYQNLGYAFQWPFFAIFVIYAYRRFNALQDERDSRSGSGPATNIASDEGNRVILHEGATSIPDDLLPPRQSTQLEQDDEYLTQYNNYLSKLNSPERDSQ